MKVKGIIKSWLQNKKITNVIQCFFFFFVLFVALYADKLR